MCLIKAGEVWVRVGKNKWQCRNCGAIVMGKKDPDLCLVCAHPRAYFSYLWRFPLAGL